MLQEPTFLGELYVNYDCALYESDVLENLIRFYANVRTNDHT